MLVGVLVGARALRLIVMIGMILRGFPRGRMDFSVIRPFLAFGLPLLAANLLLWLIKLADRFVLADARPLEEVGVYALLFNVANVVFMVALPFQAFIYPSLAKAHGEDDEAAFAHTARRCFEAYHMLALPAGVGVCLLLTPLLRLLHVDVDSAVMVYVVLLLLLGSKYAYSIVSLLKFISAVRGRSQRLVVLSALGVAINIGLNLLLTPRYGMLGAGIASCVSISALLGSIVYDLHQIRLPLRHILSGGLIPVVGACGAMALAVYPLRGLAGTWIGLLVPVAVGGAVYGAVLYAAAPEVRTQIAVLLGRAESGTASA